MQASTPISPVDLEGLRQDQEERSAHSVQVSVDSTIIILMLDDLLPILLEARWTTLYLYHIKFLVDKFVILTDHTRISTHSDSCLYDGQNINVQV